MPTRADCVQAAPRLRHSPRGDRRHRRLRRAEENAGQVFPARTAPNGCKFGGQPGACSAACTNSGTRPTGCLAAPTRHRTEYHQAPRHGVPRVRSRAGVPRLTLFTPLANPGGEVYLVDLQGNVEHTWQMPYPGIYGYLTERGTLFYNGRLPSNKFVRRVMGLAGGCPGGQLERQGSLGAPPPGSPSRRALAP